MGRSFEFEDDPDAKDSAAEMTELEFRRPAAPKVAPKPRPPLTSDLEVPVLGSAPNSPGPGPAHAPATLEVGAVLVSAAGSLLDRPNLPARPAPKDGGTMLMDAESAAIARAVSRSVSVEREIVVPDVLQNEDVKKVLMGRPNEAARPSPPPSPPPPVAAPMSDPAEPVEPDLVFEERSDPDADLPQDSALELAYNPRAPAGTSASDRRPSVVLRSPRKDPAGLPMKPILIALALIAIAAFIVRAAGLFGRS
jgi:hypothetical protein